jgi:hypothetical protein
MINIFRKIRKKGVLEHKFSKYLLYAIGEILLVVIGILIALQINNWNTGIVDRSNEKKSYQNIRYQVIEDRNELAEVKGFNNYFSGQYEFANQIITSGNRTLMDTLALITLGLSQYSDFHRSGNIYETLVNSGQLNLLKNTDITNGLQRLEMTYNHVNKLEDIHWEIIINELSPELRGVINYSNMKVVKPKKLYSVELQNFFIESIFLTKGKDSIYNTALKEIKSIIELIDEELNAREN